MGLVITAFERVELVSTDVKSEEDPSRDKGLVLLYPNQDFPAQADGLVKGIYRFRGRTVDVSCGSYHSYDFGRKLLAKMVGRDLEGPWKGTDAADVPFYELLNFADNEGVIGPKTSAKLATDFDAHAAGAATWHNDAWTAWYGKLREAFHVASESGAGAVEFH